jgi:hypothetical protein
MTDMQTTPQLRWRALPYFERGYHSPSPEPGRHAQARGQLSELRQALPVPTACTTTPAVNLEAVDGRCSPITSFIFGNTQGTSTGNVEQSSPLLQPLQPSGLDPQHPNGDETNRSNSSRKRLKTDRAPYFCRVPGCERAAQSQAQSDPAKGFGTAKDRARHEASHDPQVKCSWHTSGKGHCSRVFSRVDNMRDHVKRVHHGSR